MVRWHSDDTHRVAVPNVAETNFEVQSVPAQIEPINIVPWEDADWVNFQWLCAMEPPCKIFCLRMSKSKT